MSRGLMRSTFFVPLLLALAVPSQAAFPPLKTAKCIASLAQMAQMGRVHAVSSDTLNTAVGTLQRFRTRALGVTDTVPAWNGVTSDSAQPRNQAVANRIRGVERDIRQPDKGNPMQSWGISVRGLGTVEELLGELEEKEEAVRATLATDRRLAGTALTAFLHSCITGLCLSGLGDWTNTISIFSAITSTALSGYALESAYVVAARHDWNAGARKQAMRALLDGAEGAPRWLYHSQTGRLNRLMVSQIQAGTTSDNPVFQRGTLLHGQWEYNVFMPAMVESVARARGLPAMMQYLFIDELLEVDEETSEPVYTMVVRGSQNLPRPPRSRRRVLGGIPEWAGNAFNPVPIPVPVRPSRPDRRS